MVRGVLPGRRTPAQEEEQGMSVFVVAVAGSDGLELGMVEAAISSPFKP